ncbi:MAG: hypothetical protein K0M63_05665 [Weeksellaceae bacterium]|nr:hypothetical protein [Weeksellaceae bacterium]
MDAANFSTVLVLGTILFVWILPIVAIASSNKTTGREKAAWILAVLLISWFAWVFYLLLAPIKKTP